MTTDHIPANRKKVPAVAAQAERGASRLVERLRNGAAPLGDPNLNDEAAAEIEALRELLRIVRAERDDAAAAYYSLAATSTTGVPQSERPNAKLTGAEPLGEASG